MADFLKFTVPGKPEYVGVVRLAVTSAANTAGFDLEDIEDIQVAVSEVCSHIFCDCRREGDVHYDVYCKVGDGQITISIDDGIDPDIDPYQDESVDCFTGSGSGYDCDEARRCADEAMFGREKFPCRDLLGNSGEIETGQIFDPYTSLLMLRALMDEVDVFSDRNNRENMLIRMIKYL